MRGIRTSFRDDAGMTLVEVMVSAVILFIIATAVLGLVGRDISMGNQAVFTNAATNAVNGYVEWVRSLPFEQVDSVSGSVETTVVVTEGYEITIVPTVEDGDTDSLRNLHLDVVVRRGADVVSQYQTMAVIRDRDQYMTDRSPTTDPKITFTSLSPPDGAVIFVENGLTYWLDADGGKHPLEFQVRATATEGRTLRLVYLRGRDAFQLRDIHDVPGIWADPTWTISPPFLWNLDQKDTGGVLNVSDDGELDIWAWAEDSEDARGADMRVYLVDRVPPPRMAPLDGIEDDDGDGVVFDDPDEQHEERIRHVTGGSAGGSLTWALTLDGHTGADRYQVELYRQGVTQATYGSVLEWGLAGAHVTRDLSLDLSDAPPFSRYFARVRAQSPRARLVPSSEEAFSGPFTTVDELTGGSFVTRPTLADSEYEVSGLNENNPSQDKEWSVTPTLRATAPQFPHTSVAYTWIRVDSAGVETNLATTSVNTYTPETAFKVNLGNSEHQRVDPPSYRVRVTVTPANGTPTTVVSDKVTVPSDVVANGTFPFPPGVW